MAFSGEWIGEWFRDLVNVIILEEGFLINPRKTRVMNAGQRQRLVGVGMTLGGITIGSD